MMRARRPGTGALATRRRLLAGAFCSLATSLAPLGVRGSAAETAEDWLPSLAARIPGGLALGARYLRARPAEASPERLARELFGEACGRERAGLSGIAQRLRAARSADYRDGNLVVLDGWFVTRTEARLLALLALRGA